MTLERLNVIAAVSKNGGIGKANKLPWRIKEDMDFFNRITTTAQEGKQNVVIMGKNTWLSIPPKFRPLDHRINIVVSKQLKSVPNGVFLAKSFDEALQMCESFRSDGKADQVFVIGGHGLYKIALEQNTYPVRLYYTHVMKDFDCDVFFPEVDWDKFKPIQLDSVDTSNKKCGDIEFRFAVYEKCV